MGGIGHFVGGKFGEEFGLLNFLGRGGVAALHKEEPNHDRNDHSPNEQAAHRQVKSAGRLFIVAAIPTLLI